LLPLPSIPGRQRNPGWHARRAKSRRHARLGRLRCPPPGAAERSRHDERKPVSDATRMVTILQGAQKMLRGEVPPPPIGRLLGFGLKAIEPGRAVFEMQADERHHTPMGTLHGGVYCDLADAAMGYAYASTLAEGETFTTIELKINFLRAVRNATLT